jgi:hypothetical protein
LLALREESGAIAVVAGPDPRKIIGRKSAVSPNPRRPPKEDPRNIILTMVWLVVTASNRPLNPVSPNPPAEDPRNIRVVWIMAASNYPRKTAAVSNRLNTPVLPHPLNNIPQGHALKSVVYLVIGVVV